MIGVFVWGGSGFPERLEAQTPRSVGKISGRVTLTGPIPPPVVYTPTKDTQTCGAGVHTSDEFLVSSDGEIEHVVVSLVGIPTGTAQNVLVPVTLDQRGCRFIPHIVLIRPSATLEILNSDGVLHNVRTTGSKNPSFNKAQPKSVRKMKHVFHIAPETIRVQCDAHSWMSAWIVVQEHPFYAVTDKQGRFALSDVPPGRYTIRYWHERLGERMGTATVAANQTTTVDVAFTIKQEEN